MNTTGIKCEVYCKDCFSVRFKTDFHDDIKNDYSNQLKEICEQINICFSQEMFHTFTELSKYNQKISKNIIQITAIFYVANKQFYLPINKLTKVWEENTDRNYRNVTALNHKVSETLIKANMSPPLDNFVFIIDYALNNLSSPPKYSQKLNEIMKIISSCLKKFCFIKTPNLLCLAFYFFKDTTNICTEGNDIFNILYVSWSTFVINRKNALSCDELCFKINKCEYCISL